LRGVGWERERGKYKRVWVQRGRALVRGDSVLRLGDGEQPLVFVVRGQIGESGGERETSDCEDGCWHDFSAEFVFDDVFSEMFLAVSSDERLDVGDIDERVDDHERGGSQREQKSEHR
jgi:hypothetical protein